MIKKTYKVIVTMSLGLESYVEAENLEEAQIIAKGLDGGEFSEIEHDSAWDIVDVLEVD